MADLAICAGCTIQKAPDITYAKEADVVEWVFNSQYITILRGSMSLAYSFANTSATLVAPGFLIQIGNGSAAAETGITLAYAGEHSTITVGADGKAITNMIAARNGTATIRLLKNAPANKLLALLFATQTASPMVVGAQGVLTISYTE